MKKIKIKGEKCRSKRFQVRKPKAGDIAGQGPTVIMKANGGIIRFSFNKHDPHQAPITRHTVYGLRTKDR